jgi:hypothetical protein
MKADIEKKHLQVIELAARIEKSSPRKSDTPHNLFLEFPEIANT